MAKMIKHLAKIKDSDARVLVIFMSLPGDEDNALVLHVDTLNDMIRDELSELVETPEAQNEKDLGVFLKRKTMKALAPGVSILDWLHTSRKLVRAQTKNVIMTPNPGIRIPLNDIVKNMKTMDDASKNPQAVVSETPKVDVKHWGKNAEETKHIAENLLFEAKMLREDAELVAAKKEADARAMLDSLSPPVEEKTVVVKVKKTKKTTVVK